MSGSAGKRQTRKPKQWPGDEKIEVPVKVEKKKPALKKARKERKIYICPKCKKSVNRASVHCAVCDLWCHFKCVDISHAREIPANYQCLTLPKCWKSYVPMMRAYWNVKVVAKVLKRRFGLTDIESKRAAKAISS